ncbi:hypothetical protein AB0G00_32150 [Nocardia salmonicida]|uniref:hypothetical protein n=1 Tax=Nocardia salmonicida TaxID=53431 RepID=UPI0033D2CFA1
MGTQSNESGYARDLEKFRKRKAGICFEEQLELVVRLRELRLKGGFTNREAAARARPGGARKLVDETGEVNNKRVSDLLSPRDDRTLPTWELTEAVVLLYTERTGAAVEPLMQELRTKHQAAVNHAEVRREQAFLAAVQDGRREATAQDVAKMGAVIADLREEVGDLETRITADNEWEQITADQQRLLTEQATTMEQMRDDLDQAHTAADRLCHTTTELHEINAEQTQLLRTRESEITTLRSERDSAVATADQLSAQQKRSEHDTAWLRRRLRRARNEIAAVTAQRDQLDRQLKQTEATTTRVHAENDQLAAEIQELRRSAGDAQRVRQRPAADSPPSATSPNDETTPAQRRAEETDEEFYMTITHMSGRTQVIRQRVQRPLFESKRSAGLSSDQITTLFVLIGLAGVSGAVLTMALDMFVLTVISFLLCLVAPLAPFFTDRPAPLTVVKHDLQLGKDGRSHPWTKIARIDTADHEGRLNLTIYATDGTTLDKQDSVITPEEWEDFARSVTRVAPHVTLAPPPRQPTAA